METAIKKLIKDLEAKEAAAVEAKAKKAAELHEMQKNAVAALMSYFSLSSSELPIALIQQILEVLDFYLNRQLLRTSPYYKGFHGHNPDEINHEIGLGRVGSIVAVQCCKCKNPVDCIKDGPVTTIVMPYCKNHLISQFNFYHKHTCFLYRDLNAQSRTINPLVYIGPPRRTVFDSCPMCKNCGKRTFVTDKHEDFVEGSIVIVGQLCNECTIEYVKTTRCVKCHSRTRWCKKFQFLANNCDACGGKGQIPKYAEEVLPYLK
jgi:hypothetical protein